MLGLLIERTWYEQASCLLVDEGWILFGLIFGGQPKGPHGNFKGA